MTEGKKPTLLIALEGGLISSVCIDQPDVFEDVIVVDYDTQGAEADDLTEVEQSDGSTVPAIVHHPMVERCEIPLEQFKRGGGAIVKHRDKCKCVICDGDGTLEENARKFYEGITDHIEKHGRSVIGVGAGDDSSFAYTIGNAIAGLPELFTIGLAPHDAVPLLNVISRKLAERGSEEGPVEIGGKFPMYLLEASDEAKHEFSVQATNYLGGEGEYRLMQLVAPDLEGRYPWDAGCERPYSDVKVWRRVTG